MRTSEKTGAIAAALYAVHRDLENPRKNARANAGKYTYEYLDLPALIDHVRKPLRDAQVAVLQEVTGLPGFVEVTTMLMHLTGEFVELGPIRLPANGDAQQHGSAITYARRYALAAALNLAADADDDGKQASAPGPSEEQKGYQRAVKANQEASAPVTSAPDSKPVSQEPDTGTGASPSLPAPGVDQSDGNGETLTSDAGSVPLGGAGAESVTPSDDNELASPMQWQRLSEVCEGNATKMTNRVRKAAGTNWSKAEAQQKATKAHLTAAIIGEVA